MSSPASDLEVVSTRVFPAPRERVFRAWTDPQILARWWGPRGFTNIFQEFNLRPGGHWRFIMRGPDGTEHPNHSIFGEIVAPERIVFDHFSGPRFQVIVTFEEEGEGTRLDFRMVFETPEICAAIRAFADEGNEQNFDRLAEELARPD